MGECEAADKLIAKLPIDRDSDEEKGQRKAMFKEFDPNGNGYLSYSEVEVGVKSLLEGDDVDGQCEKLKSSMLESFNFAKKASSGDDKHGPEYLELREFRLFMQTLVQHLAYLKAFSKMDLGEKVSKDEFCSDDVKSTLDKWAAEPVEDMEAEFASLDTDESGEITLGTFVSWAVEKNQDRDDEDLDGGDEGGDEGEKGDDETEQKEEEEKKEEGEGDDEKKDVEEEKKDEEEKDEEEGKEGADGDGGEGEEGKKEEDADDAGAEGGDEAEEKPEE